MALSATPGIGEGLGGKTHHDFRAADQRGGVGWIEVSAWYEVGDHADMAAPVGVGVIDGDLDLQIEMAAPIRLS